MDELKKETIKGKCYQCIYRRDIPGDAHSMCLHPDVLNVKVVADFTAIERGWFLYPVNFDPAWLVSCNGFNQRKEKENE